MMTAFGGKWSLIKLECVYKYLCQFLLVLKRQSWAELWYIDAFSGEGVQYLKSCSGFDESFADNGQSDEGLVGQFTLGSSLRAIKASRLREDEGGRGFDHFVFIELDSTKLSTLKSRIVEEYPEYLGRCMFVQGDVNVELPKLLASIDWTSSRGVAFVDPYATQMKWSSVMSFADTCCDFWVLFPLHAIMRMMPTKHGPDDGWSNRLDEVFGSHDWVKLYTEKRQPSLFGDDDPYERESGIDGILDYASKKYEASFPGVWGPAVLRTDSNSPLFALYAIVPNGSDKALKASGGIASSLIRQMRS